MSAKGSVLKQEIAKKILATFPGSFLYNDGKEIRINGTENGEILQIKISMTCAKVAVEGGDDTALPGEKTAATAATAATADTKPAGTNEKVPQEPTAEEKERLTTLLNKLGL